MEAGPPIVVAWPVAACLSNRAYASRAPGFPTRVTGRHAQSFLLGALQSRTATASISMSAAGSASATTCTSVLAGASCGKNSARTSP